MWGEVCLSSFDMLKPLASRIELTKEARGNKKEHAPYKDDFGQLHKNSQDLLL